MTISMFETRTMLEMLNEAKKPGTFLKQLCFSRDVPHESEHVDIDIVAGKRRLAPVVKPILGSKTVERLPFSTQTYKPPQVAPDMITTAEDIIKRSAGENIYGAKSPDERAAMILTQDLIDLDDMVTRREEEMCSQALFTGEINIVGDGVNDTIQYWSQLSSGDQPTKSLGSGVRWNESGGEVLADLRTWRRGVVQKSGVAPTWSVLGSDAAEALLSNEKLLKQLDNRRIDSGEISQEFLPDGVVYYGFLKGANLDLWGYDEWYIDPADGIEKPMVPAKKILLGSSNVRTSMLYGCVVDPVEGSFAAPRVPVSYTQRKPVEGRVVAMKSRPLPAIHQIYGFYVAQVLA